MARPVEQRIGQYLRLRTSTRPPENSLPQLLEDEAMRLDLQCLARAASGRGNRDR